MKKGVTFQKILWSWTLNGHFLSRRYSPQETLIKLYQRPISRDTIDLKVFFIGICMQFAAGFLMLMPSAELARSHRPSFGCSRFFGRRPIFSPRPDFFYAAFCDSRAAPMCTAQGRPNTQQSSTPLHNDPAVNQKLLKIEQAQTNLKWSILSCDFQQEQIVLERSARLILDPGRGNQGDGGDG